MQKINEKTIRSNRNSPLCKLCSKDLIRGENHYRWNGGISSLNSYLREKITPWKIDSFEYYNKKCYLTGLGGEVVIHHLYSFSKIVKQSLDELGIKEIKQIGEYSSEELQTITEKVVEKHYEYGLGVCLNKLIHELFHLEYSFFDFTPEDFYEFEERFRDGEYDEILSD